VAVRKGSAKELPMSMEHAELPAVIVLAVVKPPVDQVLSEKWWSMRMCGVLLVGNARCAIRCYDQRVDLRRSAAASLERDFATDDPGGIVMWDAVLMSVPGR